MTRQPEAQFTAYDDEEGRAIVGVAGEVDMYEAAAFREALAAQLGRAAVSKIIIDLQACTFIDAAGLGALLDARKSREKEEVEISLRIANNQNMRRIFEITGLLGALFPEEPSESIPS